MDTIRIGMTGSRDGMTDEAKSWLNSYIKSTNNIENVHHGDCVGADTDFHNIALEHGLSIHIHPPKYSSNREFNKDYDKIYGEKDYLKRNRDIVNDTDLLLGFPNGYTNVLRSGTWSTIRYAKKVGKHVIIVYPDGSTNEFN